MKKLIVSLSLIIANGQQYLQGVEIFKAPETSSKISEGYVDVSPIIAEKGNVAIKAQAPELKAAKTTDNIVMTQRRNPVYRANNFNEFEFTSSLNAEQRTIAKLQQNNYKNISEITNALQGKNINEINQNLTKLLEKTNDLTILDEIIGIIRNAESTKFFQDNNQLKDIAIMARDKARIINKLSDPNKSLTDKKIELETNLTALNNGSSDYYNMSEQNQKQIISWYKNALDQIERQQNLQSLPFGEEAEITYKPNDTMLIRNRSEKNTAENQTLARSSNQDAIELLQQNITNLKTQAQRALDIYNSSKNSSDAMNSLGSYIKTSATIFWKQGAISRMKMQQFFIDMFTTTKTDIPETEINNMTDAAMERMPKETDSIQKQTSWINSLSNMLSDTIARFKISKNSNVNLENIDINNFRV